MRYHDHGRRDGSHDGPRGPSDHPGRQFREQRFARDPLEAGERFGGRHRHHHGGERRRLFDHGDLRFILLSMIATKPSHGYDLIKALEERMGGGYSPSPGVIYPTLTMLEEQGFARITAEDGKKLYHATAEGEAFLKANKASLDAIQARIDGIARERRVVPDPRVIRAIENLKTALRLRLAAGPIPDEQVRPSPRRSMPRRRRQSGRRGNDRTPSLCRVQSRDFPAGCDRIGYRQIEEASAMSQFLTHVRAALPEDAAQASLAGRIWRPDLAAPRWSRSATASSSDVSDCVSDDAGSVRGAPTRPPRCARPLARRSARVDALLANTPVETRDPRPPMAAGAARPAGDQGGRRDIRHLHAGARDRGACPRRHERRRGDPRGGVTTGRRRPEQAEARVGRGHAVEGDADPTGRVEPVSGGRHRAGRGDFHQVRSRWPRSAPAWTPGSIRTHRGTIRNRRWCWRCPPTGASSARRWATTSICATSRGGRRCCWARRRTTMRPAPSGRSCGCSMRDSGWTMSGRRR